jgi:hypothetical protein
MAGDGTSVTHPSGGINLSRGSRRRRARQACEEILAQRPENAGALVEFLYKSGRDLNLVQSTYVRQNFPSVSLKRELLVDEIGRGLRIL